MPNTVALPAAPRFDLTAIEARFHAGTLTDLDVRAMISELKHRPNVQETIALLRKAGEEFDRLTAPDVEDNWDAFEGRR